MAQKKIGSYNAEKGHPSGEKMKMYFFKAVYYVVFFIAPVFFWIDSLAWWQVLIGYLALHVVEGLTLALVFQLAHVVEGAAFPMPDQQTLSIEESWAEHQMHTTADFARDSWFATFFLGGLNFQIEHHLFPKICHVHYQPLSKIVKSTAEEFGIPYLENKTFAGALASHYRLLKTFGNNEEVLENRMLARA
jgi:linoleoyl-CoA desaturase